MFPNEIILHIFGYIKSLNDFINIKSTCSQWYSVYKMVESDNKINHIYFKLINIMKQISSNCKKLPYDLSTTSSTFALIEQPINKNNYLSVKFYFIGASLCVKLTNGENYILFAKVPYVRYYRFLNNEKVCFHSEQDKCCFSIILNQFRKPLLKLKSENSMCSILTKTKFFYKFGPHYYVFTNTKSAIFKQKGKKLKYISESYHYDYGQETNYFSRGWMLFSDCEEIKHLMTDLKFKAKEICIPWHHKSLVFRYFNEDSSFVWMEGECYKIYYSLKTTVTKIITTESYLTKPVRTNIATNTDSTKIKKYFELIRFEQYDYPFDDAKDCRLIECPKTGDFFFTFISKSTELSTIWAFS